MKKRTVILIILAVLLAGIIALVCWQFNNIKMAYYSLKYDNGQIETLIKDNNNDVDNYLEAHDELQVRPPTDVEQKLHQSELITEKEFIDILTEKTDVKTIFGTDVQLQEDQTFSAGGNTPLAPEALLKSKANEAANRKEPSPAPESTNPAPNTKTDTPSAAGTPSETPTDNNVNEDASAYVAKVYVLKSSFESRLDALYHEAISYYNSLSPEQKKNARGEMISRFYSRATALEADCDAQLNAILNDLSANLKATGGDMSLVSKIRQAYNNEKSLKKSYYLNLVK